MPQRDRMDAEVLIAIKMGTIKVKIHDGFVLGKSKDISGCRGRVGFKDKNGDHLFSLRGNGKCFQYYVCRAVWLASGKNIPENMVVTHRNHNQDDNTIGNLFLTQFKGKRVYPNAWSGSELQWLEENYLKKSFSWLAQECGRSIKAVRHKVKLIGLPTKGGRCKKWTDKEKEMLLTLYNQNKSVKEISKRIHRSEDAVRLHAGKLGLFRSDKHLKPHFRSSDFYYALKSKISKGTAGAECCLCGYHKHIDLHHIDGNRKNNDVANMSSLCPNHHREVAAGEYPSSALYCIWWRVYSDGSISDKMNNRKENA